MDSASGIGHRSSDRDGWAYPSSTGRVSERSYRSNSRYVSTCSCSRWATTYARIPMGEPVYCVFVTRLGDSRRLLACPRPVHRRPVGYSQMRALHPAFVLRERRSRQTSLILRRLPTATTLLSQTDIEIVSDGPLYSYQTLRGIRVLLDKSVATGPSALPWTHREAGDLAPEVVMAAAVADCGGAPPASRRNCHSSGPSHRVLAYF